MAEPHFFLKDSKSENDTQIFLIYRFGNDRLKYSTSRKINPSLWDTKTQRARIDPADGATLRQNLTRINNKLNDYVSKIATIKLVWEEVHRQALTPKILRAELDKAFKIDKETKPDVTFLQFVEQYVNEPRFVEKSNPPRPLNPETIRKYKIAYQHLLDFANKKRKGKIDFDDINEKLRDDFLKYLRDTRDQSDNTSGKNCSILHLFASAAFDAKLIKDKNQIDKIKGFKVETFNIYITESELDTIYKRDFSKNETLDNVRDYFVIGCRTALRFSDFTRIRKENFYTANGKELLKIRTVKTRQDVIIPVHWQVKAVLKKHHYSLPGAVENQTANEHLKTIGLLCGLKEKLIKSTSKGGKQEEKVYEKWQLLTTHTARRTGATLLFKAGYNATSIMQITGHTSEAALMRYLKLSKEEHALLMAKGSYFNPQK